MSSCALFTNCCFIGAATEPRSDQSLVIWVVGLAELSQEECQGRIPRDAGLAPTLQLECLIAQFSVVSIDDVITRANVCWMQISKLEEEREFLAEMLRRRPRSLCRHAGCVPASCTHSDQHASAHHSNRTAASLITQRRFCRKCERTCLDAILFWECAEDVSCSSGRAYMHGRSAALHINVSTALAPENWTIHVSTH